MDRTAGGGGGEVGRISLRQPYTMTISARVRNFEFMDNDLIETIANYQISFREIHPGG